jgi:hypothetical protein
VLVAASDVRLDKVVQDPGDVLFHVYDYGDSWELTLKLEAVSDADPDSPAAALIGGRRAAPPADCGGLVDGEELAAVLEDPDRFDLEETDALLRSPFIALTRTSVDRRVIRIPDAGDASRFRRSTGGAEDVRFGKSQLSICRPMNAAIPGTVNATIPCSGA